MSIPKGRTLRRSGVALAPPDTPPELPPSPVVERTPASPVVERAPASPTVDILPEPVQRRRITPRNSVADEALAAAAKETPYADLRQLAGLIQKPSTPLHRASSAGPTPSRFSTRRTPSGQTRTPAAVGTARPAPNRRAAPTTPHALRALQQRRAAALTPGRDRRRSGRVQRETPREVLRQLSKVLAPNTQPIQPSPQVSEIGDATLPRLRKDDFEIDPDLPVPELSIPLDEEDEDSFQPPPVLSDAADDDNFTQQSVELPRRATSEQAGGRFPRVSFGSIRYSDRFADLAELGLGAPAGEAADDSIIPAALEDYGDEDVDEVEMAFGEDVSAQDLRSALAEDTLRRQSDLGTAPLPPADEESTFIFTVPGANREATSSPPPEMTNIGKDTVQSAAAQKSKRARPTSAKQAKTSHHGVPYPSLPDAVVKRMASTFARSSGKGKPKLGKDTLAAIMQATDWFLEQVSDDVGTYASHAGRKTIEESDMITLMKRQRQINATTTPFSLAQRHLPRELLQDVRMPPPTKVRQARQRILETVEEEDEYME